MPEPAKHSQSQNIRSQTIDGEFLPVREDVHAPEFDAIDTLSRLLVGGTVDVTDISVRLLERWHGEVVERNQATIVDEEEDPSDILRYLLIGLLFESQHAVRGSLRSASSVVVGAASVTASVTRTFRDSFLFSPFRSTADKATRALEDRIIEMVQKGRNEEFVGKLMAENALLETVDWVLGYIADEPAVRDLVEQQALGFTDEVTIGVRERAITADSTVEVLLRKLFRRKPREFLPGPPEAVKEAERRHDRLEQGWSK